MVLGNGGAAVAASWDALRSFAREPGRSVAVRVEAVGVTWEAGIGEHEPRPAASLLKLPLAVATEAALSGGRIGAGTSIALPDLLALAPGPSVLAALDGSRRLEVAEALRLSVMASDGPTATWLLRLLGIDAVREAARRAGASRTHVEAAAGAADGPLRGTTTAHDALRLLAAACDRSASPITSAALAGSVRNSRIPLGVERDDVRVAHKTGSLPGVAHDVAALTCRDGTVHVAFLTDTQHDTLVSGYEMGLCTRALLEAWGLGVTRTVSVAGG